MNKYNARYILTRATLHAEIPMAAQISVQHQIVNTLEVSALQPQQTEVSTPHPNPTQMNVLSQRWYLYLHWRGQTGN